MDRHTDGHLHLYICEPLAANNEKFSYFGPNSKTKGPNELIDSSF